MENDIFLQWREYTVTVYVFHHAWLFSLNGPVCLNPGSLITPWHIPVYYKIACHKLDVKSIRQCIEAGICCHFFDGVTICLTCRSGWILFTRRQGASFCWGTMIPLKTFLTTSVFMVLQILSHLNSEVIWRNYIIEDKIQR